MVACYNVVVGCLTFFLQFITMKLVNGVLGRSPVLFTMSYPVYGSSPSPSSRQTHISAMNRLTLVQKFSLLLLAALTLFGFALGKIITSAMHQNMINRSNEMAANFLTYEIKHKLRFADFIAPKQGDATGGVIGRSV